MKFILVLLCLLSPAVVVQAQESPEDTSQIQAVTLEGGPIFSKHFQSGDPDFRQRHQLGIAKVHTKDYGNWGVYVLTPNSVDKTSVGVGYVTDPYTVPLGVTKLELSGALGLVTGYQDYPVPLMAAQARFVVYENDKWNVGASVAALPYIMQDRNGGDNKFGVVTTSPFISIRYKFE